jgi:hypothetical protein
MLLRLCNCPKLRALTPKHIWTALGILAASHCGALLFQWLMDIAMSAKGLIVRDYRLSIVPRCAIADGVLFRTDAGSIQTVLTSTVNELSSIP